MIAVILAAGMAQRLRPLTDNCPKCLLKVGERTLLQRTVDAVVAAGISEVVLVTGYRKEMITQFLEETYPTGITFHFINNDDYQHTNNIYSLWLTRPYTEGKEMLLLDSDILFDPAILPAVLQTNGNALAMNRYELGEEEIKVIADAQGMVVELSKTCSIADAIGESVGIEKMTADYTAALFKELEVMMEQEKLVNVFYERAFERLIPQGHCFRYVDTTALFSIELDTVEDFHQANNLVPASLL